MRAAAELTVSFLIHHIRRSAGQHGATDRDSMGDRNRDSDREGDRDKDTNQRQV